MKYKLGDIVVRICGGKEGVHGKLLSKDGYIFWEVEILGNGYGCGNRWDEKNFEISHIYDSPLFKALNEA